MTSPPATRYAKTSGGAHIAYQVIGEGPTDLVAAINFHPIDIMWEDPPLAAALERLSANSRLILFDRRGFGASDGLPADRIPTLEDFVEDVLAVMDTTGSARAALLKTDHVGVGLLLAASHPHRISGLILVNGYSRLAWAPDYPIGLDEDFQAVAFEQLDKWGPKLSVKVTARSRANDPLFREWFARCLRAAGGPGRAIAIFRQELDTDARELLPLVQAPTLVLHSAENAYLVPAQGQYLAQHIPGARLVELPGTGHALAAVDLDTLVDEVTEFVTGVKPRPRSARVFATVLFTDIVDSTPTAARLGDHDWRVLLDQHDAIVGRQLERFGGRLVKTTGDGAVATFDGPARAVDCAAAIREGLRRLGVHVRMGIHAGEIELRGDDVSGIAVHMAARVQAHAAAGEILVSRTLVDLVAGSGIAFDDRGEHELKGVPGSWRLFAAASGSATATAADAR